MPEDMGPQLEFYKTMYAKGKRGVSYFHEFPTDSYETSHIY